MRVGVLARGLSVPIGGVTRVLEEVLPRLPQLDPQTRYTIFHNSPRHRGLFPAATEVFFQAPGVWLWENVAFPAALRRHPVDLLLCPKGLIPFGVPRRQRVVTIVYDLLYFPLPGCAFREYPWADVAYMRLCLRRSLRRATRVMAISGHTRGDLLRHFGCPPTQVVSVPLGVTPPAPARLAEAELQRVRRTHGLDKPYVFYCGTLSPRKNVVRQLEAFAALRGQIPHDFVVTAGKSWRDAEVFRAVERLGLGARFKRLGAVPAADLPALYRQADAFLYASLYEGFGLPILEAMACGCPVLSSTASSMPEVAGEAAVLVDPYNTDAIREGLLRLLSDPALAARLRAAGAERVRAFTWERTAEGLVRLLHAAAEEAGRL